MTASPPTIALVTHSALPHLSVDDGLLVDALAVRGVRAVPVVWTDPGVDWGGWAAVVVRSCWDYHLQHARFLDWLARLEALRVRLWNPAPVLRWNAEKTYLRDLASRGVPVVPTRWLERGEATPLAAVLDDAGWERAVVKPAISASAHDTWRTSRASAAADEARLRALTARGRVLVQRFVDEVRTDGEWSLLFFGGRFSHAVVKRPAAGDFRVQQEHGGSSASREPDERVVAQAVAALHAAGVPAEALLYARVDGCAADGQLLLMELELIEPAMFLGWDPAAAGRFADEVVARLRVDGGPLRRTGS